MDPYDKLKEALRDVLDEGTSGDDEPDGLASALPLLGRLVEVGETLTFTFTMTRSKEGEKNHGPQG